MSELRFVPRGMRLVPQPAFRGQDGQPPRRVCARVRGNKWQISEKPWRCEYGTREATCAVRAALRGDLLPYDAETAAVCGVRFQPVRWVDGDRGWTTEPPPKATAQTTAQRRSRSASTSTTKDDD